MLFHFYVPQSLAYLGLVSFTRATWDVLGWLFAGMNEEQILDERPDLEEGDFPGVYQFVTDSGREAHLV